MLVLGTNRCDNLGRASQSTSMIDDVRSSLGEWKAARALLSSALQSYLTACNNLTTTCTRPAHLPSERSAVDEALVVVDSELGTLASEIHSLRTSHISMCALRNRSGKLTRINILPPEVLRHIFRLSNVYCVRHSRVRKCYNALSQVDMYWRQVALNTPELWTHVDVIPDTVDRTMYGLSSLMLERSKGEMIHLHVYSPRDGSFRNGLQERDLKKFISPILSRVVTLHLESDTSASRFLSLVMGLWEKIGIASIKHLFIRVSNDSFVSHFNISWAQGLPERASHIHLQTLHLQNATLNWRHVTFHNLVDFRLGRTIDTGISMDITQLAATLSASPKLAILKLCNVSIGRRDTTETPLVALDSLQVLNLVKLDAEPLQLVLSLIDQPNPFAQLSVGLMLYDDKRSLADYRAFFSRCHISTLYLESPAEHLSLPCLPSGLSHLIIFQSDLSQPPFIHEPKGQSQPRAIVYVTLVSCVVTLEGLVSLVAETGAQVLNLDCCLMDRLMDAEGMMNSDCEEARSGLLEVYPDLVCNISDVDTSAQLDCRTMFDD
ncbi:F-box-like protein [Ceratobasidium sp. AG-Ba]|nr:F-box-like protein [Ceratobasidium sp. AG-Ba]